jgi:hypothetical protein
MAEDKEKDQNQTRAERRAEKKRIREEKRANRSTTEKIVRGLIFPVLPWRSPVRSWQTGMDLPGEAAMLKRGLKHHRRECPECGSRVTVGDIIPQDVNGNATGEPYRAFMCNACGHHESVAEAIAEAKESVDDLKSSENKLFIAGISVFAIFAAIALFGRSLGPLIGGSAFSFSLISAALLYRYRHWQVIQARLFEEKPAILDWLKDEMAK